MTAWTLSKLGNIIAEIVEGLEENKLTVEGI